MKLSTFLFAPEAGATVISEPPPSPVLTGVGGDKPASDSVVAAFEKRAGKAGTPLPKPGEPPAQGGNAELRKSRDEAIAKIKVHEGTLKERETKINELTQQLTDFDGTKKERDTLKGRIEELEKERDGWKKLESVSALEQSPEFRKKYGDGRKAHIDRLRELAGLADISPDELVNAATRPRSKEQIAEMDTLLSSVSNFVSGDIAATVKALQTLDAERASELSNASEIMQQRLADQDKTNRDRAAQRNETRTKAWDDASGRLAKELGLSDEQLSQAADFYKSNRDATKGAEVTLRSFALEKVQAENTELKAELAKYQKSQPGVVPGEVRKPTNGKFDAKAERNKLLADAREGMGWSR